MRTAKRTFVTLMLAALLLVMLSTSVFATENGSAWLTVSTTGDGNTVVSIVTDAPVTDAYVELTTDTALTYTGIEVNSDCVAYYSVNADEAGKVKIAWVSDGNYDAADGQWVLTVTFTGTATEDPVLAGEMNDAAGNALDIRVILNTEALESAIAAAEALDRAVYTEDSLAAVDSALENAKAVLQNADAAQVQVDAAAKALQDAIAALEKIPVDKTALKKATLAAQGLKAENYTEDSYAALQDALAVAQAVLENEDATQAQVDEALRVLNEALAALELAEGSGDAPVNTDELKKLILLAEGLQKIQYSEDSFAAVESALAAGREVLANAEATQEQVDTAAEALRTAIDGLVLISGDAPDTGASFLTLPVVLLLALSAAGIAAVAMLLYSKKGRCAK